MWDIPTPTGDQGVAVTTVLMRMGAEAGARDPQTRELALKIVQGVPAGDHKGEIDAIYNWVKQHIVFRGEKDELVQAPDVTLRFEAADCDCASTLVAALLGSLGYIVDFKTVSKPGEHDFSHVYAVVLDDSTGQWRSLPLDTTVPQASPGLEPASLGRQYEWQGVPDSGMPAELGQILGRGSNMRGWPTDRYRYLGDNNAGETTADIIDAIDPAAVISAARGQQPYFPGQYTQYGYGQNYGQQSYGLTFTTPNVPLTQRPWFWPSVIGLMALGIWSMGNRMGNRRPTR
jgi:hypothetical protein